MKKQIIMAVCLLISTVGAHAQIITTYAGSGTAGYMGDGGAATSAYLNQPFALAIDNAGNMYIADNGNYRIRKVNTAGIISTVAGNGSAATSGDGASATSAGIGNTQGIAVDNVGNVYIACGTNNVIRKVNAAGVISTIAGTGTAGFSGDGGVATSAQLSYPSGILLDDTGNIYVADCNNNRIRKISTTGLISTFAGGGIGGLGDGGPATAATLLNPYNMAIDGSGTMYISDNGNYRIRQINTSGNISTVAGNGSAGFSGDSGSALLASLGSSIGYILSVAVDTTTGSIYITDLGNGRIRKVSPVGIITTIAGDGSTGFGGDGSLATLAKFNGPACSALDWSGNIYVADAFNNRIRKITNAAAATASISANIGTLSVFPNPLTNAFTTTISSADNEPVRLTITNMLGKTVYIGNGQTNRPLRVPFDSPCGTYFLLAETARGKWNGKIVREP